MISTLTKIRLGTSQVFEELDVQHIYLKDQERNDKLAQGNDESVKWMGLVIIWGIKVSFILLRPFADPTISIVFTKSIAPHS
jgi:hypothetical protein